MAEIIINNASFNTPAGINSSTGAEEVSQEIKITKAEIISELTKISTLLTGQIQHPTTIVGDSPSKQIPTVSLQDGAKFIEDIVSKLQGAGKLVEVQKILSQNVDKLRVIIQLLDKLGQNSPVIVAAAQKGENFAFQYNMSEELPKRMAELEKQAQKAGVSYFKENEAKIEQAVRDDIKREYGQRIIRQNKKTLKGYSPETFSVKDKNGGYFAETSYSSFFSENGEFIPGGTSLRVHHPSLTNPDNIGQLGNLNDATLPQLEKAYDTLQLLIKRAKQSINKTKISEKDKANFEIGIQKMAALMDNIVKAIADSFANSINEAYATPLGENSNYTEGADYDSISEAMGETTLRALKSLLSGKRDYGIIDENREVSSGYTFSKKSLLAAAVRNLMGEKYPSISPKEMFQFSPSAHEASPSDVHDLPKDTPLSSEQQEDKAKTSETRKKVEDEALEMAHANQVISKSSDIKEWISSLQTVKEKQDAIIAVVQQYLSTLGIDVDRIASNNDLAKTVTDSLDQDAFDDEKGTGKVPSLGSIAEVEELNLQPNDQDRENVIAQMAGIAPELQQIIAAVSNAQLDASDEALQKMHLFVNNIISIANEVGLVDFGKKLQEAIAGGKAFKEFDIDQIAYSISKILSFPSVLDQSLVTNTQRRNEQRAKFGLEPISEDDYRAEVFKENPELYRKYQETKAARERFDTGFSLGGLSEAFDRFFDVPEAEDGVNKFIQILLEDYQKLADVTFSKVNKKGKYVTKSGEDWVKQIVDYRVKASGRAINPNAELEKKYWSGKNIVGETLSATLKLTPGERTALQYQGQNTGAIYGGTDIDDNLELAQKKVDELKQRLTSANEEEAQELLAEIQQHEFNIQMLRQAISPKPNKDGKTGAQEEVVESTQNVVQEVKESTEAQMARQGKNDTVEPAQKSEQVINTQGVAQEPLPEQSALEKINTVLDAHNEKLSKAIELEKEKAKISGALVTALNREGVSFSNSTEATVAHNNAVEEATAVTIKHKKIASYDNDTHTYLDEQGNKFYTATQISSAYQGKNGEVFARDSAAVREALNRLPEGQQLTAEDVGMTEKDFSFYRGVVGKSIYGDMVHETRDLLDKAGVNKVQDLRGHQVEVKWEGQTKLMDAEEAYLNMIESKVPMLEKLGRSDSVESLSRDIAAIYDMLDKAHLVSTGFSEQQLGLTISNGKNSYNVAVTPDQLMFNPETGAFALTDSKTGSVSGMEVIQLAIQKAAILANKDNPELRQMYKDAGLEEIEDFDSYIVKIKDGYSELIKYLGISDEKLFQIVERAVGVLNGTAQPLSKEELKREKGALAAGRVMGYAVGAGKDVQDLINQYTSSYAQKAKIQQEITQMELQGQNYTGTKRVENQNYIAMLKRQQASINVPELTASKDENGEEVYYLDKKRISQAQYNKLKEEQQKIDDKLLSTSQRQTDEIVNKQTFFQKLVANFKNSFDQIQNYIMSIFSAQTVQRVVQSFLQETQQLDSAMVDLQIASGETRSSIKSMMTDFNKMAISMGKATTEIAQAANDWLRAGYTGQEAAELTNASMSLATLGQINSAEATSNLISVLKGWKLSTEDVIGVVDKLVTVDLSAAVSAGEIAKAMSRGNNVAQSAGTSLDRYIGYITTIADVTQNQPEMVGTALRSMYSRYSNVAAGKFVAAQSDIDSENYNAEDWANLKIWGIVA